MKQIECLNDGPLLAPELEISQHSKSLLVDNLVKKLICLKINFFFTNDSMQYINTFICSFKMTMHVNQYSMDINMISFIHCPEPIKQSKQFIKQEYKKIKSLSKTIQQNIQKSCTSRYKVKIDLIYEWMQGWFSVQISHQSVKPIL